MGATVKKEKTSFDEAISGFSLINPSTVGTELTEIQTEDKPLSKSEKWKEIKTETKQDDAFPAGEDVLEFMGSFAYETEPSFQGQRQKGESKKKELPGVVKEIQSCSVICEMFLNKEQEVTINVSLPKILFPEGISYAQPITLSYRKDDRGYRCPYIFLREISENEELRRIKREAFDVIDSL